MIKFDRLKEIAYGLVDWETHDMRTFNLSFLCRRNKILKIGINCKKTHTINLRNRKHDENGENISHSKYSCSELRCLKSSKNQNIDYGKCYMVNLRINRQNNLCLSSPCESCLSLLRHFNINKIYYTNDNEELVKLVA